MKRDEINKKFNEARQHERKEAEQQAEEQAKGEAEEARKLKGAQETKRREAKEARQHEKKEAEQQAEEQAKGEAEAARTLKGAQETKRREDRKAQESTQDTGAEVYVGGVQIVVSSASGYTQIGQFRERLGQLENLKIVWSGGSIDDSSIIAVSVQKPMNLIRILNEIPAVERTYKKGEKIVVVLKASTVQ